MAVPAVSHSVQNLEDQDNENDDDEDGDQGSHYFATNPSHACDSGA